MNHNNLLCHLQAICLNITLFENGIFEVFAHRVFDKLQITIKVVQYIYIYSLKTQQF